ncbi:MAG: dipeptide/oligopeptide/nickel ABC transporter permease/ATP-binding protein [Actinomycetota bacterium]|nr:dipeptide/oligopeptide/nickel ABC transporter permease/ATP-binding protein [Actinomycetota bacterium]
MRRSLTERLSEPGLRLRALPIGSKIALVVVALVCLLAVLAPLAGDPLASGTPVQPPGGGHLFGSDAIGRDIFARVAFGARSSLLIGLGATAVALVAAAVLGSVAATAHRWVAEVLMRLLDIIMSFPGIALAAVFVAVFGSSLPILIGAIAFLYTPQLTRVVRANVLAQFGEDYVASSQVMGASTVWILTRHVARNCIAPILVFATVLVADAIVFEASLSFINAGVRPPDPSWGNVLSDGKALLLSGYWWPTFFPGLMILITVLCLNVLSEGLTDAMISPRLRRKVQVQDEVARSTAVDSPVAEPFTPSDQAADVSQAEEDDLVRSDGLVLADGGIALRDRLAELREAELRRSDRLVYTGDAAPILQVRNLSIAFPEAHGDVDIVDNVSFDVRPGETMGLVGESGCGKSITSMAVMGLLPKTARLHGQILFDGRDVLTMSPQQHNSLRGHEIAMIYQDALSSLNPSMLIRSQLAQLTKRGGQRSAPDLLDLVGLDPARTLKSYPHELSGGQRQRVLIAMALTRNPRLVMADEPTTALDVTVQQQVVDLLNQLRRELGFAMVFVSHDLALVAQLAHRITVMYAGQVVESGTTTELLTDPRHEYTRGLLGAVLSVEQGAARLHQVPGVVPSPADFLTGDRFAPRSSHPEVGRDVKPTLRQIEGTSHRYATTPEREELEMAR